MIIKFITWLLVFIITIVIEALKFSKYLFLLFLGLKLANFISWDWAIICIPLICYVFFYFCSTIKNMIVNEKVKQNIRTGLGLGDKK